jgi:hypothetical protein
MMPKRFTPSARGSQLRANELRDGQISPCRGGLSIAPEDCFAVGQFVTLSYEGITTILLADCYSCSQLPPE